MMPPMNGLKRQKLFQLHRSAAHPVGMVAVVSMKTIMNRNQTATCASYARPARKKPTLPNRPQSCPAI
jgi:hypothetical protein